MKGDYEYHENPAAKGCQGENINPSSVHTSELPSVPIETVSSEPSKTVPSESTETVPSEISETVESSEPTIVNEKLCQ